MVFLFQATKISIALGINEFIFAFYNTILTIMVKYCLCLFFSVISFFQLIGQVLVLDTVRMQQLNLKYGELRSYKAQKNGEMRRLDIWLPEHYSPKRKYNVLYMHDGQMLFDSTQTWNHQEWKVDEVLSSLLIDEKINPTIVVGIWNDPVNRYAEFFPEAIYSDLDTNFSGKYLRELWHQELRADAYLKWIVDTIIPAVEQEFSCYNGKSHTFMMGSSMGAVISMYAMCMYPKIFGKVACMSFHGPMVNIAMVDEHHLDKMMLPFISFLKRKLPSQRGHCIYLDRGDKELDASYPPYHKLLNEFILSRYKRHHFKSLVFNEQGHNEKDWSKRLEIPMSFLLK